MEGHSPLPRVSVQSLISHDEVNANTDIIQVCMERHSPVPRISDQSLINRPFREQNGARVG